MTPEQQKYIRDNRLDVSIPKMIIHLNTNTYQIRKFLRENNLELTEKEKRRIRSLAQYGAKKHSTRLKNWTPDPWNKKLNLVTLLRD